MEVDIRHLIRSLNSVARYGSGEVELTSASEFMQLHGINIELIRCHASETNSSYFKEKISEYPSITEEEIENYLDEKQSKGRYWDKSAWMISVVRSVIELIRTSGRAGFEVEDKLKTITSINQNIIHVLENPGMEDLIRSASKSGETKLH